MVLAKFRFIREGEDDRPERLFRELLVELVDIVGRERDARRFQARIALRIDRHVALEGVRCAAVLLRPGDPRTLAPVREKAQQGRHDAVRAFRAALQRDAVFHHLVVGQAVIHHHHFGVAVRDRLGRHGGAVAAQAMAFERFQDATAAGGLGDDRARQFAHRLHQRRLGGADHHAAKTRLEHRQVVQGVARNHDVLKVETGDVGQAPHGNALADAARQHIQVLAGREQQVAVERVHSRAQFGRDRVNLGQERAAPFLRHALAHQAGKAVQRAQHRLAAGPARGDLVRERLDRTQLGVDDRGADVGDDVVRARHRRVAEQGDHGFQAAPGDEHQLRAVQGAGKQFAHAAPRLVGAGQQGAVEVGSQYQAGGVEPEWPAVGGNHSRCHALQRSYTAMRPPPAPKGRAA